MELIARTTKQLGNAIRRARKQRRLTQGQLGAHMGARQATVSTLEKGEAATQLRTLMDALAALDLELVVRPRTTAKIQDLEDIF
jgi:HTH-type transcriptional regulator/antitoxin HipB